jgi:hypothetical protein
MGQMMRAAVQSATVSGTGWWFDNWSQHGSSMSRRRLSDSKYPSIELVSSIDYNKWNYLHIQAENPDLCLRVPKHNLFTRSKFLDTIP